MQRDDQPQTITARLAPPSYAEATGLGPAPKYEELEIPAGQQFHGQPLQVPPYPVQPPLPGYPHPNNYYLNDDNPSWYGTINTPEAARQNPPPVVHIVGAEPLDNPRRKPAHSCCSRRIIVFVTFTFVTLYITRLILSVVRIA